MGSDSASVAVDIEKRLGGFYLRARFAVGAGELAVLFGHSGSGKSLSLRAIAGLLRPDAGCIEIGGAAVFDARRGIDMPPQQRGVGMVVQNYALFPHLTVAQNIGFGLRGMSTAARRARVDELIAFLELDGLAQRKPAAISGGQAQRVALARALAPGPRLLLLDEPFSALDSAIRVTLRRELARLKRELDLTIVFVTHDLREAYNLADQIAVFDHGEVLQTGSREEVVDRPVSARVAALTDVRNIWPGRVVAVDAEGVTVDIGQLRLRGAAAALAEGDAAAVCIRPERIIMLRPDRAPGDDARDTVVTAAIVDEVAHGAWHTLFFRLPGEASARDYDIEVDLPAHPYAVMGIAGERTWALAFPRDAVHVMPA